MMHVTFADKSLLMGDDAAEILLEYATALAASGQADQVMLRAIGGDGNEVEVHMLLNAGTIIASESTNSTTNAPDNRDNVTDIRRRLGRLTAGIGPGAFPYSADHEWLDEL
jgi:hypothetical protein